MAKDPSYQQQMFLYVEQFKESNLSIKQFCQQKNIRYHAFHYWYKRYRQSSKVEAPQPVFKPISIQPASTSNNCSAFAEVSFPAGHQVRFFQIVSADFLKALMA
jgi:hypothetical protein